MKHARLGDNVTVHYTLRLENGSVVDSSETGPPVEFILGEGGLPARVEQTLVGMTVGDHTRLDLTSEDGYGPRFDDLTMVVKKDRFPAEVEPHVGLSLELAHPNGVVLPVTVTGMDDSSITLDANHPLAGRNLSVDLCLVGIA